jgi:hypothetical protein
VKPDTDAITPTAAYLRRLVFAVTGDERTPLTLRHECDELIRAINANDLARIKDSLDRLQRVADAENFSLPAIKPR